MAMENDNILGKHLRNQRNLMRLTQSQIAKKLNYTTMAISKIENGFMPIPEKRILDIIRVYKIEKNDYFYIAMKAYSLKLLSLLRIDEDDII